MGREDRHETLDPRLLEVGGIITCAAGVGIALLSIFLAQVVPPYHWIATGVGVVALCIAVGLVIAAKSLRLAIEPTNAPYSWRTPLSSPGLVADCFQ